MLKILIKAIAYFWGCQLEDEIKSLGWIQKNSQGREFFNGLEHPFYNGQYNACKQIYEHVDMLEDGITLDRWLFILDELIKRAEADIDLGTYPHYRSYYSGVLTVFQEMRRQSEECL